MLDDTMLNQYICRSVLAIRSGLIMDWFLGLSVLLTVLLLVMYASVRCFSSSACIAALYSISYYLDHLSFVHKFHFHHFS